MRRTATKPRSENGQIFQQRQHADDDDDDAHDLFGATVDRQHVHEIEDEYDDKKGDQEADEDGHENPRFDVAELIPSFGRAHNVFSRARLYRTSFGTIMAESRELAGNRLSRNGGRDVGRAEPDHDSIPGLGGRPAAQLRADYGSLAQQLSAAFGMGGRDHRGPRPHREQCQSYRVLDQARLGSARTNPSANGRRD